MAALELEDDAAAALGLLELELQALGVLRVALDAVHLVQALLARLGLAGLARLRAEALDEALQAGDLRRLLVDRLAQRDVARGLLLAPLGPRAGEEARAAGLELEHRRADGLQEPAVVRDEDDGGVEREQRLLQPLQGLDVEVVGRLVEEQQVGLGGQGAGQRGAGQLPAGERLQLAVEVGVGEAQAVDEARGALAPRVAAQRLVAGGHVGVGVHRALVAGAHALLELAQLDLELDRLAATGEHVVAQRHVALARGTLIVQGHPRALRQHQLAAVDRRLARQHPQQRALARAVAPGDRHPVAALELERHAAQQRRAHHVLGQVGCDQDGHRRSG